MIDPHQDSLPAAVPVIDDDGFYVKLAQSTRAIVDRAHAQRLIQQDALTATIMGKLVENERTV